MARKEWKENHFNRIHGKLIKGFKLDELTDLDKRGLVVQFSYSIKPTELWILKNFMADAEKAGSPYCVTQLEIGHTAGQYVLWKEDKALRCKQCGAFLNARPEKWKEALSHQMVGKDCLL